MKKRRIERKLRRAELRVRFGGHCGAMPDGAVAQRGFFYINADARGDYRTKFVM